MKFVSFIEWNNTEAIGILSEDSNKVIAISEILSDFKFEDNPMVKLIKMINDDNSIIDKLRYAQKNFNNAYSIDKVKILSPIIIKII